MQLPANINREMAQVRHWFLLVAAIWFVALGGVSPQLRSRNVNFRGIHYADATTSNLASVAIASR